MTPNEIQTEFHRNRQAWEQRLRSHRRWLHQHPELSLQERETARYITGHLKSVGVPCRLVEDCGVIADLMVDATLPTVAIRAEIDALPLSEQTGLPFASACPGRILKAGRG